MADDAAYTLDNPEIYGNLDPTGFGERVGGLPQQCLRAWERGQKFSLPSDYGDVRNVVVAGVGGSAIGGDLLGDLVSVEESPLVTVCRDYHLPPYLGPSGSVAATARTFSLAEKASAHKARNARSLDRGRPGDV